MWCWPITGKGAAACRKPCEQLDYLCGHVIQNGRRVTLQICVTWQACARRELWGLLGFLPPFRSLAVTLIHIKSNLSFPGIDSYIFFSSFIAAKHILCSWNLFSSRILLQGAHCRRSLWPFLVAMAKYVCNVLSLHWPTQQETLSLSWTWV